MFFLLRQLPAHERRITLATKCTLLRIGLTPIIIMTMIFDSWYLAFFLLSIAAITDFLDGEIARMQDEKTMLGALLDPIADKMLIVGCFVTFSCLHMTHFVMPTWFIALLIIKELLQCCGTVMVYQWCGSLYIQPTVLGKGAMAFQIGVVMWVSMCQAIGWAPVKTYTAVLVFLIAMIMVALLHYAYIGGQLICGVLKNIGDRV